MTLQSITSWYDTAIRHLQERCVAETVTAADMALTA